MGYLNSILKFGTESFYSTCFESGVDGLIIPDLPLHEYKKDHEFLIKKYKLNFSFLISPSTDNARSLELANQSSGFVYLVSSNSTTGNKNETKIDLSEKIKDLRSLGLKIPIMIGFGIKNYNDFIKTCGISNGAIIGSAFIEMIQKSNDIKNDIPQFINSIKNKNQS
jgi:tryptophan synthase alpha chain